jgi:hypothetical protein
MAIVPGTAAALALLAVGGLAVYRKHTKQATERAHEADDAVQAQADAVQAAADAQAAADVHAAPSPAPAAADVDDDVQANAVVHDAQTAAAAYVDGEEKAEDEVTPKMMELDRSESVVGENLDDSGDSEPDLNEHLPPSDAAYGAGGGAGARAEHSSSSAATGATGGWQRIARLFTRSGPKVAPPAGKAVADEAPVPPAASKADAAAIAAIIRGTADLATRKYLTDLNAEVRRALNGEDSVEDLVVKVDAVIESQKAGFAANEQKQDEDRVQQKKDQQVALKSMSIGDVESLGAITARWGSGENAAHPILQIQIPNNELYSIARGDGDCGFWAVLSAMKLLEGENKGEFRDERITDTAKILLGRDEQPPDSLDELKKKVKVMAGIMQSIIENRGNKLGDDYFGGVQVTLSGIKEYQGQMNGYYDVISGNGLFQILAVLYGIGITIFEGSAAGSFEAAPIQVEFGGDLFPMVYISTNGSHYNVHAATSSPSPAQLLRIRHGGWVEESYLNEKLKEKNHPADDSIKKGQYNIVRNVV